MDHPSPQLTTAVIRPHFLRDPPVRLHRLSLSSLVIYFRDPPLPSTLYRLPSSFHIEPIVCHTVTTAVPYSAPFRNRLSPAPAVSSLCRAVGRHLSTPSRSPASRRALLVRFEATSTPSCSSTRASLGGTLRSTRLPED